MLRESNDRNLIMRSPKEDPRHKFHASNAAKLVALQNAERPLTFPAPNRPAIIIQIAG